MMRLRKNMSGFVVAVISLFIVVVALAVPPVFTLDPYVNFKEGPCSEMDLQPVKADQDFLGTLKYLSAGSKYIMFQIATQLSNFRSTTDDEFYYDACYTSNTTGKKIKEDFVKEVQVFGFGRPLFRFHVTSKPGLLLENIPTDPIDSWDTVKETVTLTDSNSFAFIVDCSNGAEERAWRLITSSPNLDSHTRSLIEEHAISLGFQRENFVFLRYDSCRWDDPIFEEASYGQRLLKRPVVTPKSVGDLVKGTFSTT